MGRVFLITLALSLSASVAQGATLLFSTNPLTDNPVLTQPGRQIVGGEPSVTFDIASDVIALDENAFGVSGPIVFFNGLASNAPTGGVNVFVLQDGAPLNAGAAASAIAAQVTTPGPGFFIYFNTNLDLPRLVFSPDLDDPLVDLAVLARFTNLQGPDGFAALTGVTSANFTTVSEPATLLLSVVGLIGIGRRVLARRRD